MAIEQLGEDLLDADNNRLVVAGVDNVVMESTGLDELLETLELGGVRVVRIGGGQVNWRSNIVGVGEMIIRVDSKSSDSVVFSHGEQIKAIE